MQTFEQVRLPWKSNFSPQLPAPIIVWVWPHPNYRFRTQGRCAVLPAKERRIYDNHSFLSPYYRSRESDQSINH
jgi:hypothetical protein